MVRMLSSLATTSSLLALGRRRRLVFDRLLQIDGVLTLQELLILRLPALDERLAQLVLLGLLPFALAALLHLGEVREVVSDPLLDLARQLLLRDPVDLLDHGNSIGPR